MYFQGAFYSFGGYNPDVEDEDSDLEDDPYWEDCKPLFKEVCILDYGLNFVIFLRQKHVFSYGNSIYTRRNGQNCQ